MNCHCYRRVLLLVALALGLCLTGCFRINQKASQNTGPANAKVDVFARIPVGQRMVSEAQLRDLGLSYQSAADGGQPPASLDDLGIKLQNPKLYQAIADKRIIVYWKANPNNAPAGAPNTVLAYDADVLTKRSAVLMLDGTVTVMEPDEFAKAPKAGK
jgi:hypothetical protein